MAERIFRPVEDRMSEIDKKIQFHKSAIATLEFRKSRIRIPNPISKSNIKELSRILIDRGITIEELIEQIKD